MANRLGNAGGRRPVHAPGGAMAARVAAHDWGATPLGPVEGWPPALRITANLVLASNFPSCLVWGEHKTMIYNDAFCPILGQKPDALGRSFQQVWAEAWDSLDPIWALTREGRSTFIED